MKKIIALTPTGGKTKEQIKQEVKQILIQKKFLLAKRSVKK